MASTPSPAPKNLMIILGITQFIAPLATDVYIPSQPAIEALYQIPTGHGAWNLSAYIISFGFWFFLVGMMNDSWGRKPIMKIGAIIYGLGALCATIAPEFSVFLAARAMQGMGSAFIINATSSLIRDLFAPKILTRALSIIGGIACVAPLLAPFLSSFLQDNYGVRGNSGFLLVVSIAVFIIIHFLPDGREKLARELRSVRAHRAALKEIITSRHFQLLTLASLAGSAAIPAFIGSIAYMLFQLNQVPVSDFAQYFIICPLSFITASSLNSYLNRESPKKLSIYIGLSLMVLASILWIIFYYLNLKTPIYIIFPGILVIFGHGLSIHGINALIITPYPHRAGTAFSLLGLCQNGAGFAGSFLMGLWISYDLFVMGLIVMGFSITALISLTIAQNRKLMP